MNKKAIALTGAEPEKMIIIILETGIKNFKLLIPILIKTHFLSGPNEAQFPIRINTSIH
jgi:hypothetical protein